MAPGEPESHDEKRTVRAPFLAASGLAAPMSYVSQSRLSIRLCDFRNYSDGGRCNGVVRSAETSAKSQKASAPEASSFVPLRNGVRAGEAGWIGCGTVSDKEWLSFSLRKFAHEPDNAAVAPKNRSVMAEGSRWEQC